MNADCVKNDLNRDLLNLNIIEKKNDDEEVEVDENQEENALPELNDVSILASSKISIKAVGKKHASYKGLVFAVVSASLFAVSAVFTKLARSLTASDIAFVRYTIQLIIASIIVKHKGFHFLGPKEKRMLLMFRGIIGTISLVTFLIAFKLIDPSDCITLANTSIIITAVLARMFLKEKLSFVHIVALLLAAVGVFLIAKPKSLFNIENTLQNQTTPSSSLSTSNQPALYTAIGVLLALACAFCSSSVQIIVKKLNTHKVHYSILLIYVTYVGVPVTFLISLILFLTGYSHQDIAKNSHSIPMSLLHASIAGVIGSIAQILLNLSLKYEDASKVSIIRSLEVLFAFFLQYFVLHISVDMFSIVGSLAIIVGTLLVLSFRLLENKLKLSTKKNACSNCVLFKF